MRMKKIARSNKNLVQQYILYACNGMNVDESSNALLESLVDKAKTIDTPEEAKSFIDNNAAKIE